MLYIEQAGGGYILVMAGSEMVHKFLYHLLIDGDGGTG